MESVTIFHSCSTFFADCENHAFLFRKHVSRKGAGKGRAILECLGLTTPQITLCYQNNPRNEEEAIQDGLNKWCETHSGNCTWQVLLNAMEFAGIAQHDCRKLVEELHQVMPGEEIWPVDRYYSCSLSTTSFHAP